MSNNGDGGSMSDVLEEMFMIGVEHGSRTIPEIEKLQAKAKAQIQSRYISKTKVLEAIGEDELSKYSGSIKDMRRANRDGLRQEIRRSLNLES